MADTKKCAHATCSCNAAEGSKYCSTICEDSKDTTSMGCDCPHSSCAGHKV